VCAAMVSAGLIVDPPTAVHAAEIPWSRLEGQDRYATAALIADAQHHAAPLSTVIVASGEDYPDALAASTLAGADGAPGVGHTGFESTSGSHGTELSLAKRCVGTAVSRQLALYSNASADDAGPWRPRGSDIGRYPHAEQGATPGRRYRERPIVAARGVERPSHRRRRRLG